MRVTTVDDRCRLFLDVFLTISTFSNFPKKGAGPGASEKPFGGILGQQIESFFSWCLLSPGEASMALKHRQA